MKRNKKMIILITVLTLLCIIVTFVIIDGSLMKKEYIRVWEKDYINGLDNDIERIIANGLTASSSHNTQPWQVEVSGSTIKLYADMGKALEVVDSGYEQMLMSQGAFIYEIVMGAKTYGYGVNITYEDVDFNKKYPLVATMELLKDDGQIQVDAISSGTLNTPSTMEVGIKETLNDQFIEYNNLGFTLIEDITTVASFKELLLEGTIVESNHEKATKELIEVFRFTERQKNEYRYGLSLSMGKMVTPFLGPIIKATANDWQSFGKSSITNFEKRIEDEVAYIVVTSTSPEQLDYIKTGEMLQQLGHELKGYSIRPAMQILQDIEGMEQLEDNLYKDYSIKDQALIIISIKKSAGQSNVKNPRHLVEDILIERDVN